MVKAFIFDMDGTVIDSTRSDYEAWQRVMDEYGGTLPYEEYIRILGAKSSEIVKDHLDVGESEIEAIVQRRDEYFKELINEKGISLIRDVEKVLKEIRSIPLSIALATGANQDKLDFIFNKLPIQSYFDTIVTADDVEDGKPAPEVFLKAAQQLGVAPEECVVVEDAQNGVEAAKNGGMRCIAITSTRGSGQLKGADLIIDNYQSFHLRRWLEKQQSQGSAKG